jgi:bifunctional non-homologous end joining protein LigD
MPAHLEPMLATLAKEPFDDRDWLFEVKWDGYRALAAIHGGHVSLTSRNQFSLNSKFAPVVESL